MKMPISGLLILSIIFFIAYSIFSITNHDPKKDTTEDWFFLHFSLG